MAAPEPGSQVRPTEVVNGVTGWTMDTLQAHYAALRHADKELETERDRRYFEGNVEREKALKIKETADVTALGLAREIQTYKDEKANELREQISSERNLYVTKDELAGAVREINGHLTLLDAVTNETRGVGKGEDKSGSRQMAVAALVVAAISSFGGVIFLVVAIATHGRF